MQKPGTTSMQLDLKYKSTPLVKMFL